MVAEKRKPISCVRILNVFMKYLLLYGKLWMQTWLSTDIDTTAASDMLVIAWESWATGRNSNPVTNMECTPEIWRAFCKKKYPKCKQKNSTKSFEDCKLSKFKIVLNSIKGLLFFFYIFLFRLLLSFFVYFYSHVTAILNKIFKKSISEMLNVLASWRQYKLKLSHWTWYQWPQIFHHLWPPKLINIRQQLQLYAGYHCLVTIVVNKISASSQVQWGLK